MLQTFMEAVKINTPFINSPQPGGTEDHLYSVLKLFAGFDNAAFIDW